MATKRKRGENRNSHLTATCGDGKLWHRTHTIIRPGTYGKTHVAIIKKPRFRQEHSFPVSMAVKSASTAVDVALLRKEHSIFKTLSDSPFISKCFGEEITYDNKGMPIHNLLLEHSYTNIGSLIRDRAKISGMDTRRITRQILKGVSVMHKFGYIHCGLTPETLLIFEDKDQFLVKIGDLGLAKEANGKNKKVKRSDSLKRNLRYLAPEVVGDKVLEGSADVWAIGCILIEMLTGRSMWAGKKDEEIKESLVKICKGVGIVRIPSGVSEEAYGFLRVCLDRKASSRSMAEMLLNHPFVSFADEEN